MAASAPPGRTILRIKRDTQGHAVGRARPYPPTTSSKDALPKLNSIDQLALGSCIGNTLLAEVFKATEKTTGRTVAVKRYSKRQLATLDENTRMTVARNWRMEVRAHLSFDHPYIVKLHDVIDDADYKYLVLEHCAHGDMSSYLNGHLGRLSEEFVSYYIKQAAFAVYYMHKHDPVYIHRDLKLENCLIDADRNLQLADFGTVGILMKPGDRRRTICGTIDYLAPELLTVNGGSVTDKADVWALGVMTYEMLVGHSPFTVSNDNDQVLQAINAADIDIPKHLSSECHDFLKSLLRRDEARRLNIEQVCFHPFLLKYHANFGDAPYLPAAPEHP